VLRLHKLAWMKTWWCVQLEGVDEDVVVCPAGGPRRGPHTWLHADATRDAQNHIDINGHPCLGMHTHLRASTTALGARLSASTASAPSLHDVSRTIVITSALFGLGLSFSYLNV